MSILFYSLVVNNIPPQWLGRWLFIQKYLPFMSCGTGPHIAEVVCGILKRKAGLSKEKELGSWRAFQEGIVRPLPNLGITYTQCWVAITHVSYVLHLLDFHLLIGCLTSMAGGSILHSVRLSLVRVWGTILSASQPSTYLLFVF